MKSILTAIAAVLMFSNPATAQKFDDTLERPFMQGGKVYMRLASAGYRIQARTDDRIVVHWTVNEPEDMDKIKVVIDAHGSQANIRTTGPVRKTKVIIGIPQRSDLYVRMVAGEMDIDAIEGNKDIRMTAGELSIVAGPESYSRVKASVTFGDLQASPFHVSKGGIKRGFEWRGSGMYTLRASLFAGEVNLVRRHK